MRVKDSTSLPRRRYRFKASRTTDSNLALDWSFKATVGGHSRTLAQATTVTLSAWTSASNARPTADS